MKSTKKSLLLSTLSLVLCFAMLLGTTYAWFTDEVTSGVNQIKAGNLDVELYHATSSAVTENDANKVKSDTLLFNNITKWEPGMVAYENFTVKNVGNLALKYQLGLTIGDKNATTAGHSLDEVLKATIVPGGFSGNRTAAQALTGYTDLKSFSVTGDGALEPGASGDTFAVVIYWQPTDHDNDYNLNNDKTAVTSTNFGSDVLGIELGVKLTAQQLPHEEDSFDKFYDKADNEVVATWSGESEEETIPDTGSVTMQVKESGKVHAEATVEAGTQIKVEGQEGTEFASLTADEKLKLTIEPDGTPNGVTVEAGESVTTYDVSLVKVVTSGDDVKVTEANTPVLVSLDIGVVDLQKFYHHGTELTKVNDQNLVDTDKYYYNQTTGMIYFKTKSFSPFASVYKFAGGLGNADHPYLIANRNHMEAISNEVNWENKTGKPAYYKVDDSLKGKTIDASNWNSVNLYGNFDGNGITFDNLDAPLFKYTFAFGTQWDGTATSSGVVDLRNFNIKNFYKQTDGYFTGAVVHWTADNIDFSNITLESGILQGNGVGGFLGQGNGQQSGNDVIFKATFTNCISHLTLVSLNYAVSGFVGNTMNVNTNDSLIKLVDSYYDGSMSCTGTAKYLHAHSVTGLKYDISYTNNFTGNAETIKTYYGTQATAPELTYVRTGHTFKVKNDNYITVNDDTTLQFIKVEGAMRAKVLHIVGLNPGYITAPYVSELIDISNVGTGDHVNTVNVKKIPSVLNDPAHQQTVEIDNNVLYITRAGYTGVAGDSYMVYQMDENGNVLNVSTKTF